MAMDLPLPLDTESVRMEAIAFFHYSNKPLNLKKMEQDVTVADSRLFGYVVLHDMHTQFFRNALDGITDKDAQSRMDTRANHIAWLAGSLVQQRYEQAYMLGAASGLQQAAQELFKDNKGIQDQVEYPALASFIKDWDIISPVLRGALVAADAKQLDEVREFMPEYRASVFEMTSFIVYREANCIGQIALWRRLLGYEAMKYM